MADFAVLKKREKKKKESFRSQIWLEIKATHFIYSAGNVYYFIIGG